MPMLFDSRYTGSKSAHTQRHRVNGGVQGRGGGWGRAWGVSVNGYRVSVWEDGKVVEVIVVQQSECT